MREKVCIRANKTPGNRSGVFRAAWTAEKLRAKMQLNTVSFSFEKKDGKLRIARGTLHPLLYVKPLGTGIRKASYLLIYWDVERRAWRSCDIRRIRAIKEKSWKSV
jgi:hypothetical protein